MRLLHKIDFMALISVSGACPNGDPLCGGRPRTDTDGYGIITDVCIKRKLRDRLSEMGENILITPQNDRSDSIAKRIAVIKPLDSSDICSHFYDVRAFGQVIAMSRSPLRTNGIRGAVSISHSFSLHPVDIIELPITRCINSETGTRRGSDTLGFKSFVRYGLYVLKGSVNTHYAERNDFSEDDAEKLKAALSTMFHNDISAARPEGSMTVERLYWWQHSSAYGDYPSHIVFGSVKAELRDGVTKPLCFEDYEICEQPLSRLSPEIYVFGRPCETPLC